MVKIILSIYRWIFARPKFQKINLALFHLSLRGMGVLNYENAKVSGESYFITKILPSVIKKEKPIFIDVGANIGNYCATLLEAFPGAMIHAFEPHPKNFSSLKSNTASNQIKCHNRAVGEERGELILYDRADCDGSAHASLHKAVIVEIHKQNITEISVLVDTLNDFCEANTITEIDFIKIDTEGNELSVLHGAKRLLENKSIQCIHFEFNEMNVVSRTFFRDFRKLLQDFDLYRLLPNGMLLLNESPLLTELFAYQNIVALPKNWKHEL